MLTEVCKLEKDIVSDLFHDSYCFRNLPGFVLNYLGFSISNHICFHYVAEGISRRLVRLQ